ncbi:hypothetical protein pb186bvf_020242 [Paramecium bursaria]
MIKIFKDEKKIIGINDFVSQFGCLIQTQQYIKLFQQVQLVYLLK